MEILFGIGLLALTVKLLVLALKLVWGLTKAVFFVLGLPLILLGLVLAGLMYLALPLLGICLIVSFLSSLFRT